MLPLRYDFLQFGGSWTQRQVFNITMIQAAVRTNKLSLALALVAELKVILLYQNHKVIRSITISIVDSIAYFKGGWAQD